ncbi:hypothetical protein GE21DRAFT_8115 [Neurospora crassa]|uniref:Uncharacterized protein n=1 Tax=Neurospora crassa (strain ATCC 24698 / 74-OR23-1A / CBS 708.71 / DSM 1257 / FGSC 987) TaxID=367110 RepID=Q1K7M8_NEUCR|nr:hypothetical protein NCU04123 [Neurospora crassa OR74A]EAA32043.3 hypothetical protein NCU04123 [Neurospora crassa OR74A]KHE87398.1 hypothetical protein GE21DRAFT_8115 [Neurospora crassa]|eukprot:XP_961279.3 hypothetical protein NCU04123 [Neurospora crassa OR74A]
MKLAERKEGTVRIKRNTRRIKYITDHRYGPDSFARIRHDMNQIKLVATGTYRPINHRTAMLPCCHNADPRTRRCHDARGRDTMVGTLDAVLTINRERSSALRRSRFCAVETMVDVVDGGDGG